MAATLIVPDGKVAIAVSSAWLPDSISDKQNKAGKLHMRPSDRNAAKDKCDGTLCTLPA